MLFSSTDPKEKRKAFKKALNSGKLQRFPGSFSPLVSLLIEKKGFEGIYISGAVISSYLGLPDVGLTSMTEVMSFARSASRVSSLPSIVDIDTGFGESLNVVRSIQECEEMGLAGCHLEDQVNPKRCGHLDHKNLVSTEEMVRKVQAAVKAKRDENFLLIARTDARASEGLDGMIRRAKAYVDAGAEMIFPEALQNEKEFEQVRKEISVPLLANMTEFGKSKLLNRQILENLGFNVVIYPVTTWRIAMGAVEKGLERIDEEGDQSSLLDDMQSRKELYELLQYERYNEFDKGIYNFKID
jgi:methylisocitrate lyase